MSPKAEKRKVDAMFGFGEKFIEEFFLNLVKDFNGSEHFITPSSSMI